MICFIGLSRSYWFIQSTRSRCCLFLVVAAALAQEFRGTILGRVTDSSGGVIANAAVTITNAGTNTAVKTTTTAAGAYTVPFLIPGSYTVAVQAAGFRTFQRQGVVVQVQDRVEISVVLEPGVVTENVVVRGETSLLQTASSSVGQVVDQTSIVNLPMNAGCLSHRAHHSGHGPHRHPPLCAPLR